MQLEGTELARGDVVFFKYYTTTNVKWRKAMVIDTNEHVKAAKVEYSPGAKTIKREWMDVANLKRNEPVNEQTGK